MKRYMVYSTSLALAWCFVHGTVSIQNFLAGFLLAFIVIWPLRKFYSFNKELSLGKYIRKIPAQLRFFWMLTIEIIKANIMVAKIVLQPKIDIKPGVIAVPIRTKTDMGITALANTITLTPGTLTIDVSDDKSVLYVHAIDTSDPEGLLEFIREDIEKYVLEAFE